MLKAFKAALTASAKIALAGVLFLQSGAFLLAQQGEVAPALLPVSPEAAWSGSYLLNHVFLSEYQLLWKPAQDAQIKPEPLHAEVLTQPFGVAAFKRASFALAAMRARSQFLPEEKLLEARLNEHFAILKKTALVIEQQMSLLQAAASLQAGVEAASGFDLIVKTFEGEQEQARMRTLHDLYFADAPSCPITADEVRSFVEHQAKLLSEGSINGGRLIAPLQGWNLKKVRCLVFAMMAMSPEGRGDGATDPLHLMMTLQQTASPLVKDASWKAIFAIRLLQTRQFAETLRVVIELVDLQPGFRLPYEMVQRIFSVSQKGDGQVALKGI